MRFACLLILLIMSAVPVPGAPVSAGDDATSPTVLAIRFATRSGIRLEIFLDGSYLGHTPLEAQLPPGRYLLTASAEGVEPIVEEYAATANGQVAVIPTVPLSAEVTERARQRLFAFVKQHPENLHLYLMALYVTPDPEEARFLLNRVERLQGDQWPTARVLASNLALVEGNPAEAMRLVNLALDANPGDPTALRQKARVLFMTDELDTALDVANEAVIQEPLHWMGLEIRARIHDRQEDFRAAFNDRQRAQELIEAANATDNQQP